MTQYEALEYWYDALREEVGIVVEVLEGSTDMFKAKLYQARRDAQDPSLEGLSLVDSPSTPNQVWIVKRDATHDKGI